MYRVVLGPRAIDPVLVLVFVLVLDQVEVSVFDHEKLDVYRVAIEFVGPLTKCRLSAVGQLD